MIFLSLDYTCMLGHEPTKVLYKQQSALSFSLR